MSLQCALVEEAIEDSDRVSVVNDSVVSEAVSEVLPNIKFHCH